MRVPPQAGQSCPVTRRNGHPGRTWPGSCGSVTYRYPAPAAPAASTARGAAAGCRSATPRAATESATQDPALGVRGAAAREQHDPVDQGPYTEAPAGEELGDADADIAHVEP